LTLNLRLLGTPLADFGNSPAADEREFIQNMRSPLALPLI
jgi:hypothetical protein